MVFKYLRNFYIFFGLIMSYAAVITGTKDYMKAVPPDVAMINIIPYAIALLFAGVMIDYYQRKYRNFEENWW